MSHDKTFEEWIEEFGDCPEELFKIAKKPFEKAVAVEFFLVHKKIDERNERFTKVEGDVSWCKWLITGLFGMTILTFVSLNWQNILRMFGVG